MTKRELIELIRQYPEFEHDLDPTAAPTDFVTCPLCGGGGSTDKRRRSYPPSHEEACPRLRFSREHDNGGN